MADEPKIIEIKVQEESEGTSVSPNQLEIDKARTLQTIQDFYRDFEVTTSDALNNLVDDLVKQASQPISTDDVSSQLGQGLNEGQSKGGEQVLKDIDAFFERLNAPESNLDNLLVQFDALTNSVEVQAQAAARAGAASQQQAAAASQAAAALGGGGSGGGGGGAIPGGVSPGGGGSFFSGGLTTAAGIAGLALLSLGGASIAFNRAVQSMTDELKGVSPDVALASAASRVQEIADRFQKADEVGGQVASLEGIRSDLASNIRGIFREGIEIIGPPLELVGTLLSGTMGLIENILSGFNFLLDIVPGWRDQDQEGNSQLKAMTDRLEAINKMLGSSKTFRDLMNLTDNLFDPVAISLDLEAIKRNVQAGKPVSARGEPTQPSTPAGKTGAGVWLNPFN